MEAEKPNDAELARILGTIRHVAVVGWSPRPERPSHYVAMFLAERGYRVTAVNPGHAGRLVHGRPVAAQLSDIPHQVDMIDIFAGPDRIPGVVEKALAISPRPRVIWMQLGIRNAGAAARARDAGLTVIQDRCPMIEIQRLFPAGWRVA